MVYLKADAASKSAVQSEADKKVERLAKLAAWKKKQEEKEKKQKDATPGGTRKLLAEMDEKANGTSSNATPTAVSPAPAPAPASPATQQPESPAAAAPYAGKFDPKAIAKKSAPKAQSPSAAPKLGTIVGQQQASLQPAVIPPSNGELEPLITVTCIAHITDYHPPVSALPQSRTKTSGFGFHKQSTDTEKVPQKRKLMLDEDETSDRKLAKLPSLPLPDVDDTPYEIQDEEEDDEAGNFAENEEEEAAAARAAQERREERMTQENAQQASEMEVDEPQVEPEAQANGTAADAPQAAEPMEIEDEDVDPLDAFMNDLESKPTKEKPSKTKTTQKPSSQEPEAYFSDDEFDYRKGTAGPDSLSLAIAAKARKKKDIPSVDYAKLKLDPIRKNFWVEPAELSEMTEAELADLRLELDGIKVSGKDVPKLYL